ITLFKDMQPLVRSVLDGYNVGISAYGQTGYGKTFTMKAWVVNYMALADLFLLLSNKKKGHEPVTKSQFRCLRFTTSKSEIYLPQVDKLRDIISFY
ncbi:unnamed protein product, partial [Thlaspi arvense]